MGKTTVLKASRTADVNWLAEREMIVSTSLYCVESFPVYPYPAFGANPFHASLDVGVTAGDGHGDPLGIF